MHEHPRARPILPDESEQLAELAELNEFTFDGIELNWKRSAPYWLGAFLDEGDTLVGAVCLSPGRPIGRLEILFLDPGITQFQRVVATKELMGMGQAILAENGSQIVCGMIQEDQPGFARLASRHGWVKLCNGSMFAKGVAA